MRHITITPTGNVPTYGNAAVWSSTNQIKIAEGQDGVSTIRRVVIQIKNTSATFSLTPKQIISNSAQAALLTTADLKAVTYTDLTTGSAGTPPIIADALISIIATGVDIWIQGTVTAGQVDLYIDEQIGV